MTIVTTRHKHDPRVQGYDAKLDADFTTTDAYQDVLEIDVEGFPRITYSLMNTHLSNGLKYKLMALDAVEQWHELKGETVLAADTPIDPEFTVRGWGRAKIQVKSENAGQAATCMPGIHVSKS